MEQLFSNSELIGKTIKNVLEPDWHASKLFISFTDNTFCFAQSYNGCVEIMEEEYDDEINEYNFEELFQLGFISEEKFNAIKTEKEKEKEASKVRKELELLKELQGKYGSVSF